MTEQPIEMSSNLTVESCKPFLSTLEIEQRNNVYVVKWQCDTIGRHEMLFDTHEDAFEYEVKMLKRYWAENELRKKPV